MLNKAYQLMALASYIMDRYETGINISIYINTQNVDLVFKCFAKLTTTCRFNRKQVTFSVVVYLNPETDFWVLSPTTSGASEK